MASEAKEKGLEPQSSSVDGRGEVGQSSLSTAERGPCAKAFCRGLLSPPTRLPSTGCFRL